MIIKIYLITIILIVIKLISLILIITLFFINKESENILKKKENYCIRPIEFYMIPEDLPISTILYYAYWNKVFDLTYFKIFVGRKNLILKILKSIKIKNIIKYFFYFYFEISRIFVKILTEIVKYDNKKSIENYLFKKFSNPIDDRVIIKIGEDWLINGSIDLICYKIKCNLLNKNTMSSSNIEMIMPRIYKLTKDYYTNVSKDFGEQTLIKGLFKNRITGMGHWHAEDIIKNNEFIGYITDSKKAFEKDNYGKKLILKEIQLKKDSNMLMINKEEIELNSKKIEISSFPFIKSAVMKGYDEKEVGEWFIEEIETYKNAKEDIILNLKNEGISDYDAIEIEEMIVNNTIRNLVGHI
jgi:hypothetical protein